MAAPISYSKAGVTITDGHLAHASKVVPAGRTFLRRMIDLSTIPKQLHHCVRLNNEFLSDLKWWDMFLPTGNGVSFHALFHALSYGDKGHLYDCACVRRTGLSTGRY